MQKPGYSFIPFLWASVDSVLDLFPPRYTLIHSQAVAVESERQPMVVEVGIVLRPLSHLCRIMISGMRYVSTYSLHIIKFTAANRRSHTLLTLEILPEFVLTSRIRLLTLH